MDGKQDRGRTRRKPALPGLNQAIKEVRALGIQKATSAGVGSGGVLGVALLVMVLGAALLGLTVGSEKFRASPDLYSDANPAQAFTGTPVGHPAGWAYTRFEACPEFFPTAIKPVVPDQPALRELCFDHFAILHSGSTKTPVFVVTRLSAADLRAAQGVARKDQFYEEGRLPAAHRAKLEDYKGSGWSRGHMFEAAAAPTHNAMAQSFSLANMVPQDQSHNAGSWARIEKDTRHYISRARGEVYVFTGPVYSEQSTFIGKGQVRVPTWLYKLVYDPVTGQSWVHWQENRQGTKAGAPITYAEFVARTGLHLLPQPEVSQ